MRLRFAKSMLDWASDIALDVNDHHLAASFVGLDHVVRLADLLEAEDPDPLDVELARAVSPALGSGSGMPL